MDERREYISKDGTLRAVERLTDPMVLRGASEARSHHEEFELYQFLEGDLWFAFEGERLDVQNGDVILVAPRRLHRPMVKSGCRYDRRRILFAKSVFETGDAGGVFLGQRLEHDRIWRFRADEVQQAGLGNMVDEVFVQLRKGTELGDFAARVGVLRLLLTAAEHTKEPPSETSGTAAEMIRYIEQHLTDALNYRTMAKAFYLSEQNLYRVFKRETGFTLAKYVKERRIIRAKHLLTQGYTAAEASVGAGFAEYSAFFRTFLRETGITPSQFAQGYKG